MWIPGAGGKSPGLLTSQSTPPNQFNWMGAQDLINGTAPNTLETAFTLSHDCFEIELK
jgi:hypothetical protein